MSNRKYRPAAKSDPEKSPVPKDRPLPHPLLVDATARFMLAMYTDEADRGEPYRTEGAFFRTQTALTNEGIPNVLRALASQQAPWLLGDVVNILDNAERAIEREDGL